MKKIIHKLVVMMTLVMLPMLCGPKQAKASTLNFSVEQELPKNQRNDNGFYDLLVSPDSKQELSIKLINDTDKPVKVNTFIHTATSSSNGVVNYGTSKTKSYKTLPYKMEDILTTQDKTITIPAKQTIKQTLNLTMPKEAFSGILAGGITFQEEHGKEEKEDKKNKSNLQINNEFAYTVAILLREDELAVLPDLKLGEVKAGQINYRNKIITELINTKSSYVNGLETKAIITKKNDSNTRYEYEQKDIQMAPDSIMPLYIPLDGHELKSGTYLLELTAKTKEKDWKFKKEFKISNKEAKKYNKQEVVIKENKTTIPWMWIFIGVGVAAIVLATIIIIHNKNKKKVEEDTSRKKHRKRKKRE